jgi:hypothetical protein
MPLRTYTAAAAFRANSCCRRVGAAAAAEAAAAMAETASFRRGERPSSSDGGRGGRSDDDAADEEETEERRRRRSATMKEGIFFLYANLQQKRSSHPSARERERAGSFRNIATRDEGKEKREAPRARIDHRRTRYKRQAPPRAPTGNARAPSALEEPMASSGKFWHRVADL